MKQNETKQKERYEAPAVLDISPVTICEGVEVEDSIGEPENPDDVGG